MTGTGDHPALAVLPLLGVEVKASHISQVIHHVSSSLDGGYRGDEFPDPGLLCDAEYTREPRTQEYTRTYRRSGYRRRRNPPLPIERSLNKQPQVS